MEESGLEKEEVLCALEAFVEVDSIDRPVAGKNGGDNGSHLSLGDQIPDERCSNSQIINKIAVEQLLELQTADMGSKGTEIDRTALYGGSYSDSDSRSSWHESGGSVSAGKENIAKAPSYDVI